MMDSDDEDMFAISDEEISRIAHTVAPNPVEEHLLKQLTNVQNKIDTITNDIASTKTITMRILNALEWRARHGEDINSDSDSDYTIEGVPVVKKKSDRGTNNAEKMLEVISQWQCVLQNKWIIGVELYNSLCCTLYKPRYYPYLRDEVEISGESMFWKLRKEGFFDWEKINSIHPYVNIVAIMVLDLPTFDRKSFAECWGTISYEINETQLQIPVPSVRLTIAETIDNSCMKFLTENNHGGILALKSTSSIEKIVNVQLIKNEQGDQSSQKQLFHFLATKSFVKVYGNVFLVEEHGSLMYCLVEVQSIDVDVANIKIFARSVSQLNVILHLLRDEFLNVTLVPEADDCVEAAMALIRELEVIRDKKSLCEIQEAKVITDLLLS